jgi:hypothetical protein
MKAKYAQQIRNGIALGREVFYWMPSDIQVRWLATNPAAYPKLSIYAARRTFARLSRTFAR